MAEDDNQSPAMQLRVVPEFRARVQKMLKARGTKFSKEVRKFLELLLDYPVEEAWTLANPAHAGGTEMPDPKARKEIAELRSRIEKRDERDEERHREMLAKLEELRLAGGKPDAVWDDVLKRLRRLEEERDAKKK